MVSTSELILDFPLPAAWKNLPVQNFNLNSTVHTLKEASNVYLRNSEASNDANENSKKYELLPLAFLLKCLLLETNLPSEWLSPKLKIRNICEEHPMSHFWLTRGGDFLAMIEKNYYLGSEKICAEAGLKNVSKSFLYMINN